MSFKQTQHIIAEPSQSRTMPKSDLHHSIIVKNDFIMGTAFFPLSASSREAGQRTPHHGVGSYTKHGGARSGGFAAGTLRGHAPAGVPPGTQCAPALRFPTVSVSPRPYPRRTRGIQKGASNAPEMLNMADRIRAAAEGRQSGSSAPARLRQSAPGSTGSRDPPPV